MCLEMKAANTGQQSVEQSRFGCESRVLSPCSVGPFGARHFQSILDQESNPTFGSESSKRVKRGNRPSATAVKRPEGDE